jgi:hypothetical protein
VTTGRYRSAAKGATKEEEGDEALEQQEEGARHGERKRRRTGAELDC